MGRSFKAINLHVKTLKQTFFDTSPLGTWYICIFEPPFGGLLYLYPHSKNEGQAPVMSYNFPSISTAMK